MRFSPIVALALALVVPATARFDSPIATQQLRGVSALPHVRIMGPDQVVRWEGSASPDEVMQHLRRLRSLDGSSP